MGTGLIVGAGVIVQGRGVLIGDRLQEFPHVLLFQELPHELLFQEFVGGWPNLPCRGALKELDPPPAIPPWCEQVPDPPSDGLVQPSEHKVPAVTLETTGTPAASERTGAYRAESRSDPMIRSRRFLTPCSVPRPPAKRHQSSRLNLTEVESPNYGERSSPLTGVPL